MRANEREGNTKGYEFKQVRKEEKAVWIIRRPTSLLGLFYMRPGIMRSIN